MCRTIMKAVCFEKLYLMIVLTAKQWNYGHIVWVI